MWIVGSCYSIDLLKFLQGPYLSRRGPSTPQGKILVRTLCINRCKQLKKNLSSFFQPVNLVIKSRTYEQMQITLDNQLETNFSISIRINNLKIIPMHFPGFWYSSQSVSASLRCNRPSYVEHHSPLQCRWIFKNVYSAIIMVSKVI